MKIKFNFNKKYKRHKWFAWYPVRVYGYNEYGCGSDEEYIVWLETIKRKKENDDDGVSWYFKMLLK